MDIEQPRKADPFTEIVEPLIEDAPDPDEVAEELLADECAKQARMTASYWMTLRENDIPAKDCTKLTAEWLWLGQED